MWRFGGKGVSARRVKRWLAALVIGVLAVVVAGCSGASGESGGGKVRVTTTTTMITDLVREVGGERVEVTGLMGPGVDPHLYKASQGDVEALLEADAVFYNGLFLEGQMGEILEKTGEQKPTVAVTEEIPEDELLESVAYEGEADPHVWFDATLWRMTVDPVVEELSKLDPEGAEGYERRGEEYKKEIDELHSYVRREISSIPEDRRVLVTAHDAFRYFGRQYGMEVRGLQGISTEAEAGAGDVRRLADYLVENEIPAIFVESSVPRRSVEAVQAACRDRGWELEIGGTLYSDAGGDAGTEAETYDGMFRANVETITEALR